MTRSTAPTGITPAPLQSHVLCGRCAISRTSISCEHINVHMCVFVEKEGCNGIHDRLQPAEFFIISMTPWYRPACMLVAMTMTIFSRLQWNIMWTYIIQKKQKNKKNSNSRSRVDTQWKPSRIVRRALLTLFAGPALPRVKMRSSVYPIFGSLFLLWNASMRRLMYLTLVKRMANRTWVFVVPALLHANSLQWDPHVISQNVYNMQHYGPIFRMFAHKVVRWGKACGTVTVLCLQRSSPACSRTLHLYPVHWMREGPCWSRLVE